jgi:hypothetical protein
MLYGAGLAPLWTCDKHTAQIEREVEAAFARFAATKGYSPLSGTIVSKPCPQNGATTELPNEAQTFIWPQQEGDSSEIYLLKEGDLIGLTFSQLAALDAALERFALNGAMAPELRARFIERAAFEFDAPADSRIEPGGVGGLLVWSQAAASDKAEWRAQGEKLEAVLARRFGAATLAEALALLAPEGDAQ